MYICIIYVLELEPKQ